MNKDNKKLTELYQLIKEGFEPSSEPELIDGPARELLDLFINAMDSRYRRTLMGYKKQYTKYRKRINKIVAGIIKEVRDNYSKGVYGDTGEEYTLSYAWRAITEPVLRRLHFIHQYTGVGKKEYVVLEELRQALEGLKQPNELDRYLSDR